MKIIYVLVTCFLILSSCQDNNPEPGLPPATQTGVNTFGCYINGDTYVIAPPYGRKRSVGADYTIPDAIFIQSDHGEWKGRDTDISMQVLPPFVADSTYQFESSFSVSNNVRYEFGSSTFFPPSLVSGSITLTRWDSEARIISGVFEFTMANGTDTVRVTEGRFDIDEVVF